MEKALEADRFSDGARSRFADDDDRSCDAVVRAGEAGCGLASGMTFLGRPGPRLIGVESALAKATGVDCDDALNLSGFGVSEAADSRALLRPLGNESRTRSARIEAVDVGTAKVDGADLRGRPGPLFTGVSCAGAGVGDGTKGYLRGRPGPLFGGESETEWPSDDRMNAGADLRGRPGGLRRGAAWAVSVAAVLGKEEIWGNLRGRPGDLLTDKAGEAEADASVSSEDDTRTGVPLRVRCDGLRKVIVEVERARVSRGGLVSVLDCKKPGADLRGRPGPRFKGGGCNSDWEASAGVGDGRSGCLRGRPGPLRGGVSW